MIETTKNNFVNSLNIGDVGLILSNNFFSKLQNWRRLKNKIPSRASHAFMMRETPAICEANGLHIKNATIIKDIGDKTKCWIFRNVNITLSQIDDILDYMDGAVENGGTYSIGGIIQFGLQFIGIRKKLTDEQGSFCSEFVIRTLRKAGFKIMEDLPAHTIDPSMLISWFFSKEAKDDGWILQAQYENNVYKIEE